MDLLGTLGVALGLAMLAGINLYLTLFITGLAVRLGWFHDSALAAALEGFGHPVVIAVALGLFVIQFIADKIPWVDSLWDSIHTFLKPAGGVLLALTSLGPDAGTLSQMFVTVLALAGSLITHGVKAGTRLTINTSPEPFSNIAASVAEDLLVIGGFMLIVNHPTAAFFAFALALGVFIYLTPRVTRAIRAILWLIWKKLRVPAGDKSSRKKDLPTRLSADAASLLSEEFGKENYEVSWCVSCVTGKTRRAGALCRNLFGDLIAVRERSGELFFVGNRNFKKFVETIDLSGALATHESRFISEGIVIHNKKSKLHTNIRFHRGQDELAERLADFLQERIAEVDSLDPAEDSQAVDATGNTEPEPNEKSNQQKMPGDGDVSEIEDEAKDKPEVKLPPLAPFPSAQDSEDTDAGRDPEAEQDRAEDDLPRAEDDKNQREES